MNKNQVIGAITQAQSALNAIPAGRVDSLRGTVAFQREIIAFRGLFALFVNALQDDNGKVVAAYLQKMQALADHTD